MCSDLVTDMSETSVLLFPPITSISENGENFDELSPSIILSIS